LTRSTRSSTIPSRLGHDKKERRRGEGVAVVYFLPFCCFVDTDSHGFWSDVSGFSRAKLSHRNRKNKEISSFSSVGCSLLRTESFLVSLDFLHGGLGINKLQFLIFYIEKYFFGIKPWIRIRIDQKCRIRIHNTAVWAGKRWGRGEAVSHVLF
jgi:hypothetical protein